MSSRAPKQIDLRRRIYALVGRMSKVDIVKHFQQENISRSTVYSIIKRFENGLPAEAKLRNGRPCKLNKQQRLKLKNAVENRGGSQSEKVG